MLCIVKYIFRTLPINSLCREGCAITRARASTRLNQFIRLRKFVRSNKYYKHCILRAKVVFTIIFLIMKILIVNKNLHNKILHNNKLHNGLEIRVHFLEILKFKYFSNITRSVAFIHVIILWNYCCNIIFTRL